MQVTLMRPDHVLHQVEISAMDSSDVSLVLENIKNIDKKKQWLRYDLSTEESSLLGRILYVLLKWIPGARSFFYSIDMFAAKERFNELRARVNFLKSRCLQELFNQAAGQFNGVTKRHPVDLILLQDLQRVASTVSLASLSTEGDNYEEDVQDEESQEALQHTSTNTTGGSHTDLTPISSSSSVSSLQEQAQVEPEEELQEEESPTPPPEAHLHDFQETQRLEELIDLKFQQMLQRFEANVSKQHLRFREGDKCTPQQFKEILSKFPNAHHLILSGCQWLKKAHLEKLQGSVITEIDLSDSNVDDTILSGLRGISLEFLRLGCCTNVTGECFSELDFSSIREIYLAGAGITNECLKSLENAHQLKAIALSNCSSITDEGVKHVPVGALEHIMLGASEGITDASIRYLSQAKNLKTVSVIGCSVSPASLIHFLECMSENELSGLYLAEILVTKELIKALALMPKLRRLYLRDLESEAHLSTLTDEDLEPLTRNNYNSIGLDDLPESVISGENYQKLAAQAKK